MTYEDNALLVKRIMANDNDAAVELYRIIRLYFSNRIRNWLGHQEVDDQVHDTFITMLIAIRRGYLKEPEKMMGYVATILRRQIAIKGVRWCDSVSIDDEESQDQFVDHQPGPLPIAIKNEQREIVLRTIGTMPSRLDREVLVQSFFDGHDWLRVAENLGLTPTQTRLRKCRAKSALIVATVRAVRQPLMRISTQEAQQ